MTETPNTVSLSIDIVNAFASRSVGTLPLLTVLEALSGQDSQNDENLSVLNVFRSITYDRNTKYRQYVTTNLKGQ